MLFVNVACGIIFPLIINMLFRSFTLSLIALSNCWCVDEKVLLEVCEKDLQTRKEKDISSNKLISEEICVF